MPAALRPNDPRRLGRYEVIGRLGSGGMGSVFLARNPHGETVALKVVRQEFAGDDEFRSRFRSEVDRARQVPPFCTAEVLDADPDHDPPYLVVEYVDGPSLYQVVHNQGPLASGRLHGLAIGVATALAAIHGAGVIHRDLKPSNVLLAPGSPKVIDFGIARAFLATSQHTRTGQMLGTVAYMAPERFDDRGAKAITPAADIFAWGAVVAYAGTGHTPFEADSAPATAMRIITQPPDLRNLPAPLRDLAAVTLAKDPADRPTARELVELLLSADNRSIAAALARQPALRTAAHEAGRVVDTRPGEPGRFADGPRYPADGIGYPSEGVGYPSDGVGYPSDGVRYPSEGVGYPSEEVGYPSEGVGYHSDGVRYPDARPDRAELADPVADNASRPVTGRAAAFRTASDRAGTTYGKPGRAAGGHAGPGQAEQSQASGQTGQGHAGTGHAGTGHAGTGHAGTGHAGTGHAAGTNGSPAVRPVAPDGRRWRPRHIVAVVSAGALVLAAVVSVAANGLVAAILGLAGAGSENPPPAAETPAIADELIVPGRWSITNSADGSCAFKNEMLVTGRSSGDFRCLGPLTRISGEHDIAVDIRLLTSRGCASISFDGENGRGYQVRVCANGVSVLIVGNDDSSAGVRLSTAVPRPEPTRMLLAVRDDVLTVMRDDEAVGKVTLPLPLADGRVTLGIWVPSSGGDDVQVAFRRVEVRSA